MVRIVIMELPRDLEKEKTNHNLGGCMHVCLLVFKYPCSHTKLTYDALCPALRSPSETIWLED